MKRTIVISDIHGYFLTLERLLAKIQYVPGKDKLVLLGDYVDGGPSSREVIDWIRFMVDSHHVRVIGGNHDDMFLSWLDGNDYAPSPYTAERNGGQHTIRSFCPWYTESEDPDAVRAFIQNHYPRQIEFLRNLPDYAEDSHHIYVHAGINPQLEDWKLSARKDFRWIRGPFYRCDGSIPVDKTIIFGHEVCARLHGQDEFSPWFGRQLIGIDGGIKFGYQLNALIIDEYGRYSSVSVSSADAEQIVRQ